MNFNDYQKQAMTTALNVGGAQQDFYYRTLGLAGEAGEIANKVKKILRDKQGHISSEDKASLASELGDALWYIQSMASFLEIDLEDIAQANLEKLFDRKKRGTIGGSGDKR